MYQDRIAYLKREIKMAYKRYTGEIIDEKATLLDVSKFFNIPVDKSRLEDYSVRKVDYNKPSIEIVDEKNDILYTATYTGNADLLNFKGATQFNSVISISPLRKEENLYYIGSETPIITKMTFTDGEYDLVFERQMANSVGIFANNKVKMVIRYFQNVVYDGKNVKQALLNQIYELDDGTLEQIYTYGYGAQCFVKKKNMQDKYVYVKNNNVIYGINRSEQEDIYNYLSGICFESTNVTVSEYLPLSMDAKNYPLLSEININSAIILNFGTGYEIQHSLQVYKDKDVIKVMYYAENYRDKKIITNEAYSLPNLSDGTISNEEIQKVLASLQSRLDDDVVLGIISKELNIFGEKIDIRKGIVQEVLDLVSPKLFMDKSFNVICDSVSTNKDNYFRVIKEKFETAINIGGNQEKGQSKVLKTNNIRK